MSNATATAPRRRFWYFTRRFAILWLSVCLLGEIYGTSYPPTFTTCHSQSSEPVVQLRWCSIPYLRVVTDHALFAAYDPATRRWHRWEVWQEQNAGGTSWGHVRQDLMHPDASTGGGPVRTQREWHGADAHKLLAVLKRSAEYPDRDLYRYWPGPNSNTYPAWVLREAGVGADLGPKCIGKDYLGLFGMGRTTTGTGYQIETPVLGVKAGRYDGLEVHPLCLTIGIDLWPPAIKTPLGRIGFPK